MNWRNVQRRIEAAESAVGIDQTDHERERQEAERREHEREARSRVALQLSQTMAPEHIAIVNRVHGWGADGQPCEPLTDPGAVHLAKIVRDMISQATSAWWSPSLWRVALPPAVAEAYLRHGAPAWADGVCNGCRLLLPWRLHGPLDGWGCASGVRVFSVCPVCGSDDLGHGYGYRR